MQVEGASSTVLDRTIVVDSMEVPVVVGHDSSVVPLRDGVGTREGREVMFAEIDGVVELSDGTGTSVDARLDPVPLGKKTVVLTPVGVREPRPRASSLFEKLLDREGDMLGAVTRGTLELADGVGTAEIVVSLGDGDGRPIENEPVPTTSVELADTPGKLKEAVPPVGKAEITPDPCSIMVTAVPPDVEKFAAPGVVNSTRVIVDDTFKLEEGDTLAVGLDESAVG
jgi:hypothetical protein